MEKLAIDGGMPAVTIPFPHWRWPVNGPAEERAVRECLRHPRNARTGIPEIVEQLETAFARYHRARHALCLSSATACLHTAFFAVGIGPGDEVIAPSVTYPATITPVIQLGGIPVLCDCEPDTANIDPAAIARKITRGTKAIVITHLWGHPCEMRSIMAVANRNRLPVIEDCSHAHGATYRGRKVGTFGAIACFSFDNQKMLAAGEAGLLITNDDALFERAVLFSDLGPRTGSQVADPDLRRYRDTALGLKYRVHPLGAALAHEKFRQLERLNRQRNRLLDHFAAGLKKTSALAPPVRRPGCTWGARYGFKPTYRPDRFPGISCDRYIELLHAEGVDIRRTVTPPLHRTPLFADPAGTFRRFPSLKANPIRRYPRYRPADFPNAERYAAEHVSFPTFTFPRDRRLIDQYLRAIRKVERWMEEHAK